MKFKYILSIKFIIIYSVFFISCKTQFREDPAPAITNIGTLNLSKYVAIGSSISAGFADNALYNDGQANAYPNLLANKFKEGNTSLVFNQPKIESENGWAGGTNGKLELALPACGTIAVTGRNLAGENAMLPYNGNKSELTNLAVPFIRIENINTPAVSAGTSFNNPLPYYNRLVDVATTKGLAQEARLRNASFFTIWLGYTDALRYATTGGTTALVTTEVFKTNIYVLLDSLLSVPNAKGVIATIPYVDQFPVITNNNRRLTSSTDPAKNPVKFTQVQADEFNAVIGKNIFSGALGNNNFYAIQKTDGSIRQLKTTQDFIVRGADLDKTGLGKVDSLSVRNCIANLNQRSKLGFAKALSDTAVLDKEEIITLRAQIDAYNNAIIEAIAERNNNGFKLALVDMNLFYKNLLDPSSGIQYGSLITRANHASLGPDFGGFYSLDRINPTPRGQSLIANEFIKSINQYFGSNFTLYDPASFRANKIP